MSPREIDALCINTLRTLAMDAVQKANSGHPGMPMGAAPMAYVLFDRFLRYNPRNPKWVNRDRFVLSAGHGSMLLYGLLHLTGYDLPLEELKRFRQLGSKTPGHPEYGHTVGVETTTGPLGQGFANAVGMALAEAMLAARFNRPGMNIIDHHTYGICGDGDLMEGISSEAASLAGHLGLGKLIFLYDDNHISIEGSTELAFTEDVAQRFEAYGWQTVRVADGTNLSAIESALNQARAETARPSLILVRNHIGYGSPHKQDTAGAHGSPLGKDEIRLTKEALGWPPDQDFYVPPEALSHFRQALSRGSEWELQWETQLGEYAARYPQEAQQLRDFLDGQVPAGVWEHLPRFLPATGEVATRSASGKVLNALAGHLPSLVGGSADLAPSTDTLLAEAGDVEPGSFAGRNLHFGVREHAMAAMANGMCLHGGFHVYDATFLIFSDYERPAIRLAALMGVPVVHVLTHDSIALGEDGPTHQPVEQLSALRAIPNLVVLRPADANETAEAWRVALSRRQGPCAIVLSRQKLPVLDPERVKIDVARGAYIVKNCPGVPELILLSSGAEVHLALNAADRLSAEGTRVRVVSMTSMELFRAQDADYREEVLPSEVQKRLAIEAAGPMSWYEWVGSAGHILAMQGFGASAPAEDLFVHFGFTPEHVVEMAHDLLRRA